MRSILARSKKCVSAHKAGARFHFASAKLLNNLDILPQKSQKLQKIIRFSHKTVKIQLFLKIFLDFLAGYRKSLYLCTRKQETTVSDIAKQWCNGNTADSGPAFPGSSPGIPTRTLNEKSSSVFICFVREYENSGLVLWIFRYSFVSPM